MSVHPYIESLLTLRLMCEIAHEKVANITLSLMWGLAPALRSDCVVATCPAPAEKKRADHPVSCGDIKNLEESHGNCQMILCIYISQFF